MITDNSVLIDNGMLTLTTALQVSRRLESGYKKRVTISGRQRFETSSFLCRSGSKLESDGNYTDSNRLGKSGECDHVDAGDSAV